MKFKYNDEITVEWSPDLKNAKVWVGEHLLESIVSVDYSMDVGRTNSGFLQHLVLTFGVSKVEEVK